MCFSTGGATVDEIEIGDELAGEIGMRDVDLAIDDGDGNVAAGGDAVEIGEPPAAAAGCARNSGSLGTTPAGEPRAWYVCSGCDQATADSFDTWAIAASTAMLSGTRMT